jgi:hypothetical protein
MNDLDLRTALHRDADLVGEPSPNLLEQLTQRRRHQRRQRAGVLTAALAVAVIVAGVPVGQSLLTRADGGPASTPTVDETPSVSPDVEPTPPVVTSTPAPDQTVTPSDRAAAGSTTVTQEPTIPTSADAPVGCPTLDELRAVLPLKDALGALMSIKDPFLECSGAWAIAYVNHDAPEPTEQFHISGIQLFHYVDGAWAAVFDHNVCSTGEVPAAIDYLACHTG